MIETIQETIVWLPVKNIHPNKYNPNAMTKEQDAQLLEDMRQHGPEAVDPIIVRPDSVPNIEQDQYEIIDGEHRWNHAVALSWELIRCIVRDMTLAEAKAVNYRKNRERGTIDPFKEAELFKSESDEGMTQEQIAKKYGIDRSQVSKRISLLNIAPEIKNEITKVPRVTVSHLEPIATMSPQLQKESIREIKHELRNEPTVSDVEDLAKRLKEKDEERRQLKTALLTAKFKKCPECGEEPEEISYSGLPRVHCRHYHEWSLETGKEKREIYSSGTRTRAKGKKPFEGFLRTRHTIPEISRVFTEAVRSMVDDFTEISDIQIEGKRKSGAKGYVHADVDTTSTFGRQHTIDLIIRLGKEGIEHISAEPKTYASKRLKDIKALVRSYPAPKNAKDLKKFETRLEELFRRFGKKSRAHKAKKRKR